MMKTISAWSNRPAFLIAKHVNAGGQPPVDTLVGTSLGGYTLIRLLGSGGMGAVYLAADSTIGQQVAIKIVRTDAADYPDIASAIRAAERFKQEELAISSLGHLPIPPLYLFVVVQTG